MSITTVSFEQSDPKSMEAAIQTLKAAKLKYYYGLALAEDEQLLRSVAVAGIAGPGYFWMIGDTGLNGKEFDADDPIVKALYGIGSLRWIPMSPETWKQISWDFNSIPNCRKSSFRQWSRSMLDPNEFFTNVEFFDAVTNIEFDGASGKVRLDPKTQTRDVNSVRYALMNMLTDSQGSVGDKLLFQSKSQPTTISVAATIRFCKSHHSSMPTTPQFRPINCLLEVDQSLIGQGIRTSGLVLCGLTILNAVGWMCFTILPQIQIHPRLTTSLSVHALRWRDRDGNLHHSMGLQEPVSTEALNVACLSSGCCRLDLPVDPLRWVRGDLASYDTYGRVTKTAGSCACESQTNQIIFYVFFFLLNASALVIANWQSYLSRNYETEFNESANIAFSMLLLTEAAVLGLPVLFLVKKDAGSFFLVRTILIVITSVGVLLPIFLPKVSLRNKLKFDSKRSLRSGSSRLDDSSAGFDSSAGMLSISRRRDDKSTKVPAMVVQTLESKRSDSANSLRVAEVFESGGNANVDDSEEFTEVRKVRVRRVSFIVENPPVLSSS
ncbi:hypothetical protein MHU86_4633 [Fragilaria crotonensis]|nr:hypothetical protein MHU86_4633 [Fragilaria crotonensis]